MVKLLYFEHLDVLYTQKDHSGKLILKDGRVESSGLVEWLFKSWSWTAGVANGGKSGDLFPRTTRNWTRTKDRYSHNPRVFPQVSSVGADPCDEEYGKEEAKHPGAQKQDTAESWRYMVGEDAIDDTKTTKMRSSWKQRAPFTIEFCLKTRKTKALPWTITIRSLYGSSNLWQFMCRRVCYRKTNALGRDSWCRRDTFSYYSLCGSISSTGMFDPCWVYKFESIFSVDKEFEQGTWRTCFAENRAELFHHEYTVFDGFVNHLGISTNVSYTLRRSPSSSVRLLQVMFDMIMFTFPGQQLLKERQSGKLWSPIVHQVVKMLQKEE